MVATEGKNYESDRESVEISDRKKSSARMDYSSFSAVSILRLVDFDNQNEVPEKTHNFFPLETSQKVRLAADLDRFKQFSELRTSPKFRTAFHENSPNQVLATQSSLNSFLFDKKTWKR